MPLLLKPFYVMRHGQSEDNARGLISGAGSDPNLTELGQEQARLAREIYLKLSPVPTRIVVSTLKRTHQTAELVVGHTDFIIEAGLNERHLGELDGKISEAEQKARKTLPGEESSDTHRARVITAINTHLSGEEIPLFVCHGGTVRRIIEVAEVTGIVHIGNAEIYKLSPDADKFWTILAH